MAKLQRTMRNKSIFDRMNKTMKATRGMVKKTVNSIQRLVVGSVRAVGNTSGAISKQAKNTLRSVTSRRGKRRSQRK